MRWDQRPLSAVTPRPAAHSLCPQRSREEAGSGASLQYSFSFLWPLPGEFPQPNLVICSFKSTGWLFFSINFSSYIFNFASYFALSQPCGKEISHGGNGMAKSLVRSRRQAIDSSFGNRNFKKRKKKKRTAFGKDLGHRPVSKLLGNKRKLTWDVLSQNRLEQDFLFKMASWSHDKGEDTGLDWLPPHVQ